MELRRVCVYCSSASSREVNVEREIRNFGREITQRGIALVYGGSSRGLMGALADSWGSTRHADGEIAIWFEVLRGPAPTREQYGHRFAAALAAHREAHH